MDNLPGWISLLIFLFLQAIGFIAAAHAIVYKRDPKSSIAWTGLILLSPGIGTLLYWWLGINRINRRAKKIYETKVEQESQASLGEDIGQPNLDVDDSLLRLIELTSRITNKTLHADNNINPLINGEQTYPEMLSAIKKARNHVLLCTYIFENDGIGKQFAKALKEAGARGVLVRVLIDDIGARYSFPTIIRELRGENVIAQHFHKTFWPWTYHYAQLRNHRKLLVVDGEVAFIGGLNIRDEHFIASQPEDKAIRDLHFTISGSVIEDLQKIFFQDWEHTSNESLSSKCRVPKNKINGRVSARVIPDGPDEDLDKLRWTIIGAITAAEHSISIVTPYFLPDPTIIAALGVAATKGVAVNVVFPENNNHKLVHWACMASLWQLLERGCKVFLSPFPFDHSKIFVVDKSWSLIGSANWDPRSLRLNFELNVECYDKNLAIDLDRLVENKIEGSRNLKLSQLEERSFALKLRDGVARLLSPYL